MASFQIQSSEVLARLKPFGITFEKSLSDLIKGIRAHSKESPESLLTFLDTAIQECKDELSTTDLEVKATAVLKLAYLEMYGFDMSWCNFRILEVMSSAKFQQKRIGYLASMQSFKNEQDLLILATNQFKKDLNSHNHIEIGLALSGIATIVTPALAKDIVDDVVMKLTHSKPYIRKKAILALFKVFIQYPESLRSCLPRVIEKLDDTDVSVVSATITVICEISKKNPNIFVNYLPKIFSILEESTNNWLTIRILKLFQSLLKVEPRMKKKILPYIITLMNKTDATSLVYECINCIVNGGMLSDSSKDRDIAKQCIESLMKFFDTGDSNLKYVGLLALIKIVRSFPIFIHKVLGVAAVIMQCLTDKDLIIKQKALEICHYLVTEDNIADLVKLLLMQLVEEDMNQPVPENIKLEITHKILEIASHDNYSNIPNFKWYVTALKELVDLTVIPSPEDSAHNSSVSLSKHASDTIALKLGTEFKSLAVKVPSIRPFILSTVVIQYAKSVSPLECCPILMRDLYWIMGEYADQLSEGMDEEEEDKEELMVAGLGEKVQLFNCFVNGYIDRKLDQGTHFPVSKKLLALAEPDVLCLLIQGIIKLFSSIISDYQYLYASDGALPTKFYHQVSFFLFKLIKFLENFDQNLDYEVQERALSWLEFLKICMDALHETAKEGMKQLEDDELKYYKELFQRNTNDNSNSLSQGSDTESSSDEDMLELESDGTSEEENDDDEDLPESKTSKGEEYSEDPATGIANEPTSEENKELPQLLTQILPSFFKSYELNPVSNTAQKRIALPDDLDLETSISEPPEYCLIDSDSSSEEELEEPEERNEKDPNSDEAAKERIERLKDDPYYITTGTKKKLRNAKQSLLDFEEIGATVDKQNESSSTSLKEEAKGKSKSKSKKLKKEKVVILREETIDGAEDIVEEAAKEKKKKKPLFSNAISLENFSLDSLSLGQKEEMQGYEYDIDLEALRSRLAEKDLKKARKDKKKKVKKSDKPHSREKQIAKEELSTSKQNDEVSKSSEQREQTPVVPEVTEVKTTKKKKKKKAVILD